MKKQQAKDLVDQLSVLVWEIVDLNNFQKADVNHRIDFSEEYRKLERIREKIVEILTGEYHKTQGE